MLYEGNSENEINAEIKHAELWNKSNILLNVYLIFKRLNLK